MQLSNQASAVAAKAQASKASAETYRTMMDNEVQQEGVPALKKAMRAQSEADATTSQINRDTAKMDAVMKRISAGASTAADVIGIINPLRNRTRGPNLS